MGGKVMDERVERMNGQVSFVVLMLTQVALGGIIAYKRYGLGMAPGQYAELLWVLGLSIGVYWTARLYLSGSLPVISARRMAALYVGLVALVAIPTLLIHGWPGRERWFEVLYPFVGVGVVLGFYALVAALGKRHLERLIGE